MDRSHSAVTATGRVPARACLTSVVTNVCSQAIFASSIPEIIDLVGSRSKYGGEYKREHGKRYTNTLITAVSPHHLWTEYSKICTRLHLISNTERLALLNGVSFLVILFISST